jgi:hypothetical protein
VLFRSRMPVMFACLLLTALGASVTATTSSAATDSWSTTFQDDFSGSGLPNPANWTLDLGTSYPGGPAQFGTGEVETLTNKPANVDVRNGSLYITPQRDSAGNWTSARMETNRADFKPAAGGTMQATGRIQMPDVLGAQAEGYWPAFWMLGSPYRADRWSWPGIGEFDIMENVQGINKNWATLHCGTWGGPCHEPDGISNNGMTCPGATCQSAFHLYSFQWDRSGPIDQLRWYTDGQLTHKVDQDEVPAATWTQMTVHAGYFMILNVSVGGAFPDKLGGGPTAATLPGVPMIVDYVQVQYKGGAGGGTSTVPTAPTTPTTTPTVPPATTSTTGSTAGTTTAPSVTAPAGTAPSNLTVTSTTATSITLGWKGSVGAVYDVLRSGIRIATVTATAFTDAGLNKNTPYLYSVRANGITTPQVIATISDVTTTTTTPPPTATSAPSATTSTSANSAGPSNLHSTGSTATAITLVWTGSATASYNVLRSGIRIATVTGTHFTDIGLNRNTPYIYSIQGNGITTPPVTVNIP